jgi:hypothetical protein
MYRDRKEEAPGEVDTILGDLIERGRKHGASATLLQAAFVMLTIYQQGRATLKAAGSQVPNAPTITCLLLSASRRLQSSRATYATTANSFRNFGERSKQGETVSTAFVELTINQVVSRRFPEEADTDQSP